MADTRLPDRWLNNPDFDDLSDAAWRVFTGALMWSNGRLTDGHIPARYLKMLHPDGEQPAAFLQMEKAALWGKVADGYQMGDWAKGLGQSTAAQIEHNKEVNRLKQQKWRDEQAKKFPKTGPTFTESPSDVTSDVPGDVTGYVGQDRTVTETADSEGFSEEEPEAVNEATGEVFSPEDSTPRYEFIRKGNKVHRVEVSA